jgi:hypothetical protein
MPLPKPRQGENRSEFISRCMSNDNVQNESANNDQALAICSSLWEDRSMNTQDKLLKSIRAREQKRTEFGYGILTADKYVRTMQEFVGTDLCTRLATDRRTSFGDILLKAGQTLVYGNKDMIVEESRPKLPDGVEMPKNTLMVFKHVLTTPRKDRDGDILRTEGAAIDPALPLLWQHVHTLPIGKMLSVAEHTTEKLSLVSAIIDINELAHDAAVMVENKMGRFSHGFRAVEFKELEVEDEEEKGNFMGFDITKFEIMEESLVSVPSNVDAEEEEIMLSLVDGGKLTSGVMKEYGKTIRERRPLTVSAGVDSAKWTISITTPEGVTYENEPGNGSDEAKGTGGEGEDPAVSSPEETEDDKAAAEETPTSDEKVTEPWTRGEEELAALVKQMWGVHPQTLKEFQEAEWKTAEDWEKDGRTLSKANLTVLKNVKSDLEELQKNETFSRGGTALCERCVKNLDDIISLVDEDQEEREAPEMTVKEAIALFVAEATDEERNTMSQYLQVVGRSEDAERRTQAFRALLGIS